MNYLGRRTALLIAMTVAVSGLGSIAVTSAASAAVQCSTPSAAAVAGRAEPAVAVALAPIKIWMAGDSTMQNPSGGCPVGWGSQFGALFSSDATVVNRAVGARSIQTWLYDPNVTSAKNSAGECVINPNTYSARWQEMLSSSTGMKAGDYLFIQFGINDSSPTCNRHVGLAAFEQSYGVMAQAAQARGAHPIFVTPLSAIACTGTTAHGTRGGYPAAAKAAGVQLGVPVIDLHQLSVDLYNARGFCPIPGGDVTATTTGPVGDFFCADHTHLEDAGAVVIAGLVANALRTQGIALAGSLR